MKRIAWIIGITLLQPPCVEGARCRSEQRLTPAFYLVQRCRHVSPFVLLQRPSSPEKCHTRRDAGGGDLVCCSSSVTNEEEELYGTENTKKSTTRVVDGVMHWIFDKDNKEEEEKRTNNRSVGRSISSPHTSATSAVTIRPSKLGRGDGDGLFLTKPVSKNDIIMVIPKQKCIRLDDAWDDPELGSVFCYLTDEGGPGARIATLAAFVAKEWLKVKYDITPYTSSSPALTMASSQWQEYLRILPWDEYDHGQEHILWWPQEKVELMLGGSRAYDEAITMRTQVETAIENTQTILLDPDLYKQWDPEQKLLLDFDRSHANANDEIAHAVRSSFVSIFSRAFEDSAVDSSKLVPLLDMAQHCCRSDSDFGDESKMCVNIHHETNPSTGDIVVKATRDMPAGEELLNNYSNTLEPHQFFTMFGFVPGESIPVLELLESQSPIFFEGRDSDCR